MNYTPKTDIHDTSCPCAQGGPCCVLLVDDDPDIRSIVRHFLEREYIQIVEASNGRDALEHLQKRTFNLLIIDLLMPGMDGFGVLHELQQQPQHPGVTPMPIIVLSSMSQQVHQDRVRALGATDFVVKPVDPEVLYTVVRRHLSTYITKGVSGERSPSV